MSPILPISFLVTLLCAFGAVEGVLFQQLMFVGAALSATILVCSLEAWSAREIPLRSDDEIRLAQSLGPLTGRSDLVVRAFGAS